MKVKKESEKVGLKLNIQKTKIMASCPITSWQIDAETMETVTDYIFFSSKFIADGDCGHEVKRHLLLGRKAMTNLDSILKSREITLPTKVHLVQAMVFPVVMYRCKSCTIKKSWKSALNISWKDWCWSWSSNTLTTWCEELTHWKRPWCWERLKTGWEGDDRA